MDGEQDLGGGSFYLDYEKDRIWGSCLVNSGHNQWLGVASKAGVISKGAPAYYNPSFRCHEEVLELYASLA